MHSQALREITEMQNRLNHETWKSSNMDGVNYAPKLSEIGRLRENYSRVRENNLKRMIKLF